LSRAHVSDAIILRYLRDQGAVYSLNSDDVAGLRKAGVSQSIVDYMMQTPGYYGPGPGYGPGPYWGGPYDPAWGPYWGGPYWGSPYPYAYGYGYHHWH